MSKWITETNSNIMEVEMSTNNTNELTFEMLDALQQAQSFIHEITQIDGKYSYLNSRMNGTVIISDAYSVLRATESAIAKVKGEQP
jgi:hypothetical protein